MFATFFSRVHSCRKDAVTVKSGGKKNKNKYQDESSQFGSSRAFYSDTIFFPLLFFTSRRVQTVVWDVELPSIFFPSLSAQFSEMSFRGDDVDD